jgi:2-polyprenyl-3-methyl-5-hydroxy-6-metoxy-1,4-benzoquinol methylase
MKNKFGQRSEEKELMDDVNVPQELLFLNLQELDILNRTLGGHSLTLQGIKKLITNKHRTYHIVDLGCGSGDTMRYIANWAKEKDYKVRLTGVDMNSDTIEYLKHHCKDYPEINGTVNDYREFLKAAENIDIVHCSLFCHHLNDYELENLLTWVKHNAQIGLIINDLQRNWLAYYSAKVFTRILNGSILAKNDGPVSVLRGFKQKELKALLQKAGIEHYSIVRKWAFRYLVVGHK